MDAGLGEVSVQAKQRKVDENQTHSKKRHLTSARPTKDQCAHACVCVFVCVCVCVCVYVCVGVLVQMHAYYCGT